MALQSRFSDFENENHYQNAHRPPSNTPIALKDFTHRVDRGYVICGLVVDKTLSITIEPNID